MSIIAAHSLGMVNIHCSSSFCRDGFRVAMPPCHSSLFPINQLLVLLG